MRFDPHGRLERRTAMPVQYPTMPAYGGYDRRTLYVTSATWKLDAEERSRRPLEGGLFALDMDVPGLPTALFDPNR